MKLQHNKILAFALTFILVLCFHGSSIRAEESESPSADTSTENTIVEDTSSTTSSENSIWPKAPTIHGKSAILMDADTGAILYEKKSDKKMYPASITKVMTAILTLSHAKMDEKVTFSHNAVFSVPPSYAHLAIKEKEKLSVKNCLYGLLLASANDVANALAEHVSGSIEEFGKLMTQTAADLGCTGTNFVNPSGCHAKNHYTTAHDMALIMQKALTFPDFQKISGTYTYTIPKTNKTKVERTVYNKHRMINTTTEYYDKRVICGKTGYTQEAGNTLVTCAKSGGRTLICVILNDNDGHIYPDTRNLFNYGFKNFTNIDIAEKETRTFPSYKNPTGGSFITLPKNLSIEDTQTSVENSILTYTYEDHLLGKIPLVTDEVNDSSGSSATNAVNATVDHSSHNSETSDTLWKILKIIFIILVTGFVIFLLLFVRAVRIRKKKRLAQLEKRKKYREKHRS